MRPYFPPPPQRESSGPLVVVLYAITLLFVLAIALDWSDVSYLLRVGIERFR
jgi:hypothetical protein